MGFEEFIAYCIWGYLIFDQLLLLLTKSMGEREGDTLPGGKELEDLGNGESEESIEERKIGANGRR